MGTGAKGAGGSVILKRKKVIAGSAHHGGAWKVAYADFVTAMMAFFLLMWLLNATTDQQKKGLADYFAPTVPMARMSGGSDGLFGGDSPTSLDSLATVGDVAALGVAGATSLPESQGEKDDAAAEAAELAALQELEDVLLGRGGESLLSDEALRHVITRLTDEGLVIEVFAREGAPIFAPGAPDPTPVMAEIVGTVAALAAVVENGMAVAGHVPAAPPAGGPDLWDLSTDRAHRVLLLLEEGGVPGPRLRRVAGHADRAPAVADARALRNDRIEIILLRRDP